MLALIFILSDPASGRSLGHGLICPDARYASVAWADADCLDRRHVATADWRKLEFAINVGLPNTPLERSHVVTRILVPDDLGSGTVVQWVLKVQMASDQCKAAEHLDNQLRWMAGIAE